MGDEKAGVLLGWGKERGWEEHDETCLARPAAEFKDIFSPFFDSSVLRRKFGSSTSSAVSF